MPSIVKAALDGSGTTEIPQSNSVPSPPGEASAVNSFQMPLSGNIRLSQHAELVPAQRLLGHFVVFHAQSDDRFAFRMGNQGVKIIDVQFGFEQSGHQPAQLRGHDLYHHQ